MVGRALAGRLSGLGHDVVIGTRDVQQTLTRTEPDSMGTPPYSGWQKDNATVRLATFPDAGTHGELVINATSGVNAMAALEATGSENLAGKVLVDLALPLDFSGGMPPRLTIANTDSLGEQVQRAFPDALVVKTLNTMFKDIMVDPARLPGHHNIFIAGNDTGAKETVTTLLTEFGWQQETIIDLGSIQSARATEMYMQMYFNLVGVLDTFEFNIAIVRA
ncbi:hypothetical protein BKA23_1883 [Rudaeicoccus suwonensis]|uniref:Pyrroline-5-carboxylate reductase catalytic N-terminal domain-containing protein n=2 Tax=Rudaeicoccus suwonensis TaxID=657409 RepID=A0A561EBR9_9MICO|nr:hypothetical protein BKA23_1883 [Rudaeicoccus suwonensis]